MFKLYNTLTQKKQIFRSMRKNVVLMYSCGPTVYDFAHIGNFRAYLFADLLYRYLRYFKEYKVRWVMNITDIDDKTIKASKGEGDSKENLKIFTRKYEYIFFEDLKRLHIGVELNKRDFVFHFNPRATETISEMQDLTKKILKNGFGYIKDGSVYFDVMKYAKRFRYGKLIHIDLEGFRDGVRIDTDEYTKENVKDFVLWKAKKDDEPVWNFFIDSQNYPGRPGWHIECSAMSHKHLGDIFDIHTGGVDLKFPHHENEIAQSTAGYGKNPSRFWCHNEHLLVDGNKMSKSLGNFYTLRGLLEKGYAAKYFRYFILTNHYRTKLNFTFEALESAKAGFSRLQEVVFRLQGVREKRGFTLEKETAKALKDFEHALDDDFNTSLAISVVFEFVNMLNVLIDEKKMSRIGVKKALAFFRKIDSLLCVFDFKKDVLPTKIFKLIQERDEARKRKDFKTSDRIRDELLKLGIELKDTKEGTQWAGR